MKELVMGILEGFFLGLKGIWGIIKLKLQAFGINSTLLVTILIIVTTIVVAIMIFEIYCKHHSKRNKRR